MRSRRGRPTDENGFTLIEVMIAIAILSMALVTVFGSNIGGARSASHGATPDQRDRASSSDRRRNTQESPTAAACSMA